MLIYYPLVAQTTALKNVVYLEGLGNNGVYSFNYEKLVAEGLGFTNYIRIGFGVTRSLDWSYLSPSGSSNLQYNVPLMFVAENGLKKIKFEWGFGPAIAYGEPVRRTNIVSKINSNDYDFAVTGTLGIRYTFSKTPIFLKVAYTPIYDIGPKFLLWTWIGLGAGYAF